MILHEKSGEYSVIRNSLIAAIEVSDGRGVEKFVKFYFGGGLSRTISVANADQAIVIVRAAVQ